MSTDWLCKMANLMYVSKLCTCDFTVCQLHGQSESSSSNHFISPMLFVFTEKPEECFRTSNLSAHKEWKLTACIYTDINCLQNMNVILPISLFIFNLFLFYPERIKTVSATLSQIFKMKCWDIMVPEIDNFMYLFVVYLRMVSVAPTI